MTRTNLVRQNKNLKVAKKSFAKYVLLAVGVVLAISSVLMTVETATSSLEVASLRKTQSELSMEKRNLESALIKSLSVNDLEQKSSELAFVKPDKMVYISESQDTVAKLP